MMISTFPRVTPALLAACRPLQTSAGGDHPTVFRYNKQHVIKCGPHVHPGEVEAMRILHKQKLPVPKPLEWGIEPATGWFYFWMKYVEGESLSNVWDKFDDDAKSAIIEELKAIMSRVRLNTSDYIGSLHSAVCNDNFFAAPFTPTEAPPWVTSKTCDSVTESRPPDPHRRAHETKPAWYGPFKDEVSFREGVVRYLAWHGKEQPNFTAAITAVTTLPHYPGPSVFTHGELAPENILVKDGHIVAILDWNMAGYYPVYWEYVKANLVGLDIASVLLSCGTVRQFLDEYPYQLAAFMLASAAVFGGKAPSDKAPIKDGGKDERKPCLCQKQLAQKQLTQKQLISKLDKLVV